MLTSSIGVSGMTPLIGTFKQEFHLTTFQAGLLFSVLNLGMIVVAVPAGVLGDRLGERAVAVGASLLVCLSFLGQGLANSYWLLLASRSLLGIGNSAVWTTGPAWLSNLVPASRRASAVGGVVAFSRLGGALGPAFFGFTAEQFGVLTPFAVVAGGTLAVAVLFSAHRGREAPIALEPRVQLRPLATVRAVRGSRVVVGAIVFMVIIGMITTVNGLLLPLHLRANGLSTGTIGAAYSATGVLGVITAVWARRVGESHGSMRIASLTTFLIGLALLLPVASGGTPMLLALVLLSSVLSALLVTVTYPLGTIGAHEGALGPGAVMGLLNGSWGIAATVSPIAAGAVADAAGDRVVYAALAAVCFVALLAIGRGRRRAGSLQEVTT
jgi:MFS family permease